MSADGKWIVAKQRNVLGAALMRADEIKFKFRSVRTNAVSSGQILAGPANRYWTFGKNLYPLDLKWPVLEFSGNPVAIHPRLDLVASFSPNELKFFKLSNAKPIKQLPLTLSCS